MATAAVAVAAAFLSMRGASENVSKPQPTEPDERGDLYRFGSRSRSLVVGEPGRTGCGREKRVAGVETVVRARYEESTEPRSETEKREERERPTGRRYTKRDETTRKDVEREKEEKEGGRGEANAEQEEARQDGRTRGRAAACLCLCFGK